MINNVVLAGNTTEDPEVRSTTTGKKVASFRLAVNNPLNDKETLFIKVETWDKQSEFVGNYVKKGSSVSVIGRLKLETWEKDGRKNSAISVVADRVNFVGGKKKDASASEDEAPAQATKSAAKPAYKSAAKAPAQQDDDEVPY
jgi:single-strand DNA-binding protein